MLIGVINYHFHSTLFIFSSLLPHTTTKQSLSGAETTNSHVQYQHLLLYNKYNNNISSSVQTLDAIFDGETTTQAFPVDIESTKTLGGLKDFIKRENPNYLRDVDARNQRVWWMSILLPQHSQANSMEEPVALDDVQTKILLGPAYKLVGFFVANSTEMAIHLLVQ
ncbi:hypothetical protein BKA57DRAFT_465365 [Linnemannia elongata]|nr:hypothetical protein BKA57DRAFT_465365 [Linnemannia elongata]